LDVCFIMQVQNQNGRLAAIRAADDVVIE
jgi:hypothetical protein